MTPINVRPGIEATHDVSLSDGVETWGFRLDGGMSGMQEVSAVPSTLKFTPGGQRFGDFEPGMSHLEQRTWVGGRGQEDFFEDPSRFFDSMNAWTLTDGKLLPTIQWKMVADAARYNHFHLPGDMNWKSLLGTYRYLDIPFTPTSQYDANAAFLWVRRIGTPGTLTVSLCDDNAGVPGTVQHTGTVTTNDITDVVSVFQKFGTGWAHTLTGGTQYHLLVYGDAGDNSANHWEIGSDPNSTGGKYSTDGAVWNIPNPGWKPYFFVTPAGIAGKHGFFYLGGELIIWYTTDGGTSSVFYFDPSDKMVHALNPGPALGTIKEAVVCNNIAYFAQGSGKDIMRMRRTGSHVFEFAADDDELVDNRADYLCVFIDPTDGTRIYKALADACEVKDSAPKTWGNNLAFSNARVIGDTSTPILAMRGYDDKVMVRKSDSLWGVKGTQTNKVNIGLDAILDTHGVMTDQNLYLFFSYGNSIERYYPGTLDDVGFNKGTGLPTNRAGVVSSLQPLYGWMLVGVDAGATGYSSILVWDGKGYHEIFRAPGAGMRIRSLFWDDVNQRLWFSCGGYLLYQDWPKYTLNPLMDSAVNYQHEATLITSSMDMGWAEIYKFFKEFSMRSRNLETEINVGLDYQTDREIGGDVWNEVANFVQSPRDVLRINRGKKLAIRFRLRLVTDDASVPPVVIATVLKGFARTPTKRVWNLRIKTSSLQTTRTGAQDVHPDELYNWLWKACQEAGGVRMRTTTTTNDDVWVIVEPPTIIRKSVMAVQKMWSGRLTLTLREM